MVKVVNCDAHTFLTKKSIASSEMIFLKRIPEVLSKAYDFKPYDLQIAKLEAYGFKKNALKLV